MNNKLKAFCTTICLLMLFSSHHIAYAQQPISQQAFAIFEQHCLDCHGEFGSYSDVLTIKHKDLIEARSVIPEQPDASELYMRLLDDTDTGSQMPLGQEPLDADVIATIRRWIEAGAPDWEAIPKPKRRFITTEAMLQTIHTHVTSLTAFNRSFARYFTLTHLYNAGASDDNLRAYRNALSKLVNSLSWGAEVIKPTPIDQEKTIFYIDLRHYEWDIKSDKWYRIEQAYPYGVQLKSSTYTTLCQETNCELPFVRADWFIATASLPPLYHEILGLPETDKQLETQLEVNVAENLKNAPGVRVWRAGFNESGVSVNNRIVERHKSRYGAYWKSYDFAGNVGTQNIFTHPLNFTHDGGEIIFNLPNGLQAYYLSTATGDRLDEAPINIVSDTGSRDPVVRNGLSCMGCHTEGMKTFEDQVRSVIEQNLNPSYDKAQALRLYVEKSEMDSLVREDIARYRQAIEAAGGVFGGSEPIQQLVKQFEGALDATHAAAEVGLETDKFLQKIHGNSALQNAGLLVLGVEKGTIKRDAWASQFDTVVSELTFDQQGSLLSPQSATRQERESTEGFVRLGMPLEEALTKTTFVVEWLSGDGSDEVIFQGEGVIRTPDKIELRIPYEDDSSRYSSYTILTEYAVETNRYIFVPLDDWGGGSGIFRRLHAVDKKTLRTVEEIALGGRSGIWGLTAADPATNTIAMTYIREEDWRGNLTDSLDKAIKGHLRMIDGKLRDVADPLSPIPPDMVFFRADRFFRIGSYKWEKDAETDEKPQHNVHLDAFYMDKYETTNAQYKEFIDANPQWQKNRIPKKYHDGDYLKHWNGNDYPPDKANHPVVYVSWYAAMAYAKWRGKRLPTEAEWERAARSSWHGHAINADTANYGENVGDTTPVGTYPPGESGLYDIAGNVWEWCLDEYNPNFYATSPSHNPLAGGTMDNILSDWTNVKTVRVLRGGSWVSNAKFVRVSDRTRFTPKITNKARGFRCVKAVVP